MFVWWTYVLLVDGASTTILLLDSTGEIVGPASSSGSIAMTRRDQTCL